MGATLQRTSVRMAWPRIGAGLLLVAALAVAPLSVAQRSFPTPEAAVDALVDGLARNDDGEVRVVLGPDFRRLIPLDVATGEDVTDFLAAWSRGYRVERDGANARLVLNDGWSLPIPIVRSGEGWVFDVRAGAEEMRIRRIGRNELAAISPTASRWSRGPRAMVIPA